MPKKSAFVGQHDGDGWLRIVQVERAASGDEFDEPGASVVVADIERNGHAVNASPAAANGKPQHGQNIPKPARLVLAFDALRHGHELFINPAREENREADEQAYIR